MNVSCGDCVTCPVCEAVAYCLAEIAPHPCPHDGPWCEDHRLEECVDCRLEAERDMYRSGEYDPRADPFYRPEAEAVDAAYWDRSGSTYDPRTDTHRRIR